MDWEGLNRYNKFELRARQAVEGFMTGLHSSPLRGFSVEFSDYRAYNQGESTKNIDWKLFARTDRLYVKNFMQETNLRCVILLDQSRSMCFPFDEKNKSFQHPDKRIFSVYAAAAVIQMLYNQRDAFALGLISSDVDFITPVRSSNQHRHYIFSLMEALTQKPYTDFPQSGGIHKALDRISESIHRRSMVVVFSDLMFDKAYDGEFIRSLEHLRHMKHEVLLFHVLDDRLEGQLAYKNRPYKFVDAETSHSIKLNPVQFQQTYSQIMQQRMKNIRTACNNLMIDCVQCDINQPYDRILRPYFYKRRRLM
ncbi:MAG: DUF58 domain-containing protein [Bacteroidales bacterium]|nr:DUF58 domain-containing protein [Bacteroidales bacterium]